MTNPTTSSVREEAGTPPDTSLLLNEEEADAWAKTLYESLAGDDNRMLRIDRIKAALMSASRHGLSDADLRRRALSTQGQGQTDGMRKALAAVKDMLPFLSSPQGRALAWGKELLPTETAIRKVIDDALAQPVEAAGLRKALEEIATPDKEQGFYVLKDGERVLVAYWSQVQWRMDAAKSALAATGGEVKP